MIKNNFIYLLNTFSNKEIKNFSKFLKSPYFNGNTKISELFREILKFYPGFNKEKFTKEYLFNTLYPGKEYLDSTLRNLFFHLHSLAEKFLVIEYLDKNELEFNNLFLKEVNGRYVKNSFYKIIKRSDEICKNFENMSRHKFLLQKNLESYKYNFVEMFEKHTKVKTEDELLAHSNNVTYYLTLYYLCELIGAHIRYYFNLKKYDLNPIPEGEVFLIDCIDYRKIYEVYKEYDSIFFLEIYLSLIEMYSKPKDDEKYFKYKNLVLKYTGKFTSKEINFHWAKLINYCILKTNQYISKVDFNEELDKIYRKYLENKYYYDGITNYIHEQLFRGVLLNGINLKKNDWIKYFIEKYHNEVKKDMRDSMYYYGYAYYYLSNKEYEKSLEFTNHVSLDNFIFRFDVKDIKMKCFYSLGYYEELNEMMHSYRELIKNDKIMPVRTKKKHRDYLNFFGKLINLGSDNSKINPEKLEREILSYTSLISKNWLLDKIKNLKNKKMQATFI